MIIDGADQAKSALPAFADSVKCVEAGHRFKLHLYGVKCHGLIDFVITLPDHIQNG
jgi:hypothetical protein